MFLFQKCFQDQRQTENEFNAQQYFRTNKFNSSLKSEQKATTTTMKGCFRLDVTIGPQTGLETGCGLCTR